MSQWAKTLDALIRERGRELYGFAYALTENRFAADNLLEESLYQSFRRGSAPATVEEASARVRDAMLALTTGDQTNGASAAPASSAQAPTEEAIAAGTESLGNRGLTEPVRLATHRARADRRRRSLLWSAAAVVAIGAAAIAANAIGADPAPAPSASGVVVPAGTIDATYLIGESSNRSRTSTYPGPAGLRCAVGADNPHLTTTAPAVITADCASVWLSAELVLTLTTDVSVDPEAGTVTLDWGITSAAYPVLVDRAGVIGVLTTGSPGFAEDVAATETSLAATTTWTSNTTQVGVLNSREDLVVITPGGDAIQGSTTWTSSDSEVVTKVLAGEAPFQVELQMRVGSRSETRSTEMLVSLTDDNRYEVKDGDVIGTTSES